MKNLPRLFLLATCCWLFSPLLAASACGHDLDLGKLDPARRVLVLGEVHGTHEAPEFALETACALMRKHKAPVSLALEYPIDEGAELADYLQSSGDPVAVKRLLSAPFWRSRMQDGRSSVAMLRVIERVRRLQAEGARISLRAFDAPIAASDRDGVMALNLTNVLLGIHRAMLLFWWVICMRCDPPEPISIPITSRWRSASKCLFTVSLLLPVKAASGPVCLSAASKQSSRGLTGFPVLCGDLFRTRKAGPITVS